MSDPEDGSSGAAAGAGADGGDGARRGTDPAPLAVGWGLVVTGTALGSGPALFAGVAAIVGGMLFLVGESRRLS